MSNYQKITISAIIIILIAAFAATWVSQDSVGYAELDPQARRSPSDAAEWLEDARRQLGLGKDSYLLAAANEEVTGDNSVDGVLLIGKKTAAEDRFARKIDIIVRDGKSGRFVAANLPNVSGYESTLFIGDFNGDRVKDVMVTAPSGGSGGIVSHTITAFSGLSPSLLFSDKDNSGAAFSGRFLDGFQAELANGDTGRKTRVDIAYAKSRYIETGVYRSDGKLLKSVQPHTYPYGSLEPVDLNHDGTYELKGVQKVIGAYNADVVAYVYSYWKYASSQHWTLQQLEVSSLLLGVGQEVPSGNGLTNQAVSKQMKSQNADVSYPQFEDISDQQTRDFANQVLEGTAREIVNLAGNDSSVAADYEVMRSDADMLSILFTGSQKQGDRSTPIIQPIIIDLKGRNVVAANELFRSDRQSRELIDALIADAAKQAGISDVPAVSDAKGAYITNQTVVLIYQASGQENYTQLSLPLEKSKPYFSEPFTSLKSD